MKTKPTFPPATFIRTSEALARLIDTLVREPLVAVDTESNSLYAYRERVCLIQLSTRSADYIVDPLVVEDMQPLGVLLADPAVEKVFHAAEYDILCMKRDFGFAFVNLFDTMIAARICGHKAVGLGALLETYAGVQLDKSHQRDDWGKRPLPQASLLYAQMDTHYLPLLRDVLGDELTAAQRWVEAREAFDELTHVTPNLDAHVLDSEGYWRISLPNRLTGRQTAVLRELYLLRETIAQQRDLPPFKIFSDKTMVILAQLAPHSPTQMTSIDGMSEGQIRRYAHPLIEAIQRGEAAVPPVPPARPAPADPDVVERYTALREWRKQRASERGVESDVIISKDTLWLVAERMPRTLDEMRDIPGLGPYRLETYGEALLDVLKTFRRNGR